MKKFLFVLTMVMVIMAASACGIVSCKADGCSDEVYKDGYCKYHYTVSTAKNEIDNLGKGLFDSLIGK